MKRDRALEIIASCEEFLKQWGVKSLAMFGSVARDEATRDSDLDLLIEFESGKGMGLSDYVEIQQYLENCLGCDVDLVVPAELKPRLRDRILSEALPVLPKRDRQVVTQQVIYQMPRKDWQIYIEDILEAIAKIDRYTKNLTFADFQADELKVDAVIRNFTIIGEAVRKIPPDMETRHPQIPRAQMRGMRNRVVHEYRSINLETVWDVIRNYLTPLVPELRSLLDEPDDS